MRYSYETQQNINKDISKLERSFNNDNDVYVESKLLIEEMKIKQKIYKLIIEKSIQFMKYGFKLYELFYESFLPNIRKSNEHLTNKIKKDKHMNPGVEYFESFRIEMSTMKNTKNNLITKLKYMIFILKMKK